MPVKQEHTRSKTPQPKEKTEKMKEKEPSPIGILCEAGVVGVYPNDVVECTSCKLCAKKCPTEVDLEKVVRLSRYISGARGSHRDAFRLLNKMMTRAGSVKWLKGVETSESSDIVYFPGCLPVYDIMLGRDTNYSGAAYAGVRVLNKLGIKPQIVYDCCAHDLYYSGALDEFENAKAKLTEKLKGKKIITGCAECYHTLKNIYGLDVEHFSDFVLKKAPELKKLNIKTTYHDPCRLGRFNNKYDAPRELLNKISDFREMEHVKEDALCCGVSSWLNCSSVSKEIRLRRLKEALDVADVLVVSCPKCRVHLDCIYYTKNYKGEPKRIKIMDLQELVAQSLGVYDPSSKEKSYAIPEVKGGVKLERFDKKKDMMKYIDDALLDAAFRCTTCRTCTEVCLSKHDTSHLMENFRKALVEKGLNPAQHKKIYENITKTGNPFGETADVSDEKKDADIIYFPGCVAKYRRKDLIEATKKIFDELGVKYTIPKGLVCCGSVLFRTGYDASEIVKKNKAIIGNKKVVCACSGCYATLKKDYGLGPTQIVHLVEFLQDKIDRLKLGDVKCKVVYHDPCHLGRKFKVYEEPRKIISSIPGTQLVEFSKNRGEAQCCGAGGGVKSSKADIAKKLASKKVEEAEKLGVDAIVSSCPFCELNIGENTKIPVYDVSEYVAKAMGERKAVRKGK